MEPRTTHTTQDVAEQTHLEQSIDAIELTDEDLEKVTGTWGGFGGMGHFGFRHFSHFRGFPFRHFHNGTAIAINTIAIAG